MKKISFVIPVYNEQENILNTYEKICQLADELSSYKFEFIFTDNRSTDESFGMLSLLGKKDDRVRVIRFSRNFGYQKSIYTGYMAATGDAIIQLDCDLEDPPEVCKEFIDRWENGADVVYGVRLKRQESWFKTFQRKMFYRFIDLISKEKLPHDAGDFRLIDRRVADVLSEYRDSSPYLRGTLAVMGFKQESVEYERDQRFAGTSKFSFSANLRLAMDGIINHSTLPLKFASFVGFFFTALSILSMVFYLILRLTNSHMPAGFSTTVILLLFGIGLNSLFIGIMGEYMANLYSHIKSGPITVIDQTCNFSDEDLNDIKDKLRIN